MAEGRRENKYEVGLLDDMFGNASIGTRTADDWGGFGKFLAEKMKNYKDEKDFTPFLSSMLNVFKQQLSEEDMEHLLEFLNAARKRQEEKSKDDDKKKKGLKPKAPAAQQPTAKSAKKKGAAVRYDGDDYYADQYGAIEDDY